jgi:hypothetical protein
MTTVTNNCYVDLYINSESGRPEHIYNSLNGDKLPPAPVTISWWAKNSKFAVVVGLIVIFVLIGCSLSVGYSIGNNACEKREKNHFHRHDESRFKKTTKLSTLPNRVSTKSNDLETTTSLISITNSRKHNTYIRNNSSDK